MGYNNRNNNSGWSRGNYRNDRNNDYNNGGNRRGNGGGKPPKRSGSTKGIQAKGENKGRPYVTGWNASKKRGFISMIAAPTKQTKEVTSTSGKKWENWMVKITFKDQGRTELMSGMYEVATGRLIIEQMGMIANPKAPEGGYFGTLSNKNR